MNFENDLLYKSHSKLFLQTGKVIQKTKQTLIIYNHNKKELYKIKQKHVPVPICKVESKKDSTKRLRKEIKTSFEVRKENFHEETFYTRQIVPLLMLPHAKGFRNTNTRSYLINTRFICRSLKRIVFISFSLNLNDLARDLKDAVRNVSSINIKSTLWRRSLCTIIFYVFSTPCYVTDLKIIPLIIHDFAFAPDLTLLTSTYINDEAHVSCLASST